MLTGLKKSIALMLSALAMLLFFACSANGKAETEQPASESGYSYTFTDSLGSLVSLDKKPDKVAVLFSSYAEMWSLAGGEVDITVGESIERGFAPEGVILVDEKSGHSTIDLETLIANEPDLVIGTADYECQAEAVSFCREHGIPAAAFTVESYTDYLSVLRIFCDITENEQAYLDNGQAVGERIEVLLGRVEDYIGNNPEASPKILFVRAGSSASSTKAKSSDDNFACAMLKDLHCENIADADVELTGSLSTEAILLDDPDYLFITTMGSEDAAKDYMNSLLSSSGWKDLSCVSGGRYTFLPKEMFHFKPNSKWAQAYEYLIEILYPEVSLD